MKFLILPLMLSLLACTTTEKNRAPSSTELWNLQQITLTSEQLSGECDLSPSSEIRRSNMTSQTTLVAGLQAPGCNLNSKLNGASTAAIVFEGAYSKNLAVIRLTVKLGDLEYATTEQESNDLDLQGYKDVHLTGNGVYKLKPTTTFTLKATCEPPVLSGIFGFRKNTAKCTFDQNAGTIILNQE